MSVPSVEITGCGALSGIFNFFKKFTGSEIKNINNTKTLYILNEFRKANNNESYERFNTIKTKIDTEDDDDPDEVSYSDLHKIIRDYKISCLINMDMVGGGGTSVYDGNSLFVILKKIQNASSAYNNSINWSNVNTHNNSNNLDPNEYDNIISAISDMASMINPQWNNQVEIPSETNLGLSNNENFDGTISIDATANCSKLNTYTISTHSFEPTITYWSPDQNNYSLCLSNEPVSGETDCGSIIGEWTPEQSNEPEPRCDGTEPEPCCNEPEPCTNEPIFEQGKCDISNLCLTATCEPDSEPEPSDLCCQEGFGNMSSYEIFMKKIGFLLLISIIILFIYNERRSIKLLFR